jgi:ferredoxin
MNFLQRRKDMKAVVNAEACVGCGLCANMCAEVFLMEDDKAIVIGNSIADEMVDSAKEAATSCPVEAIVIE